MVLHLSADGNVRMKIDNNSRISLSNNDSSGTTTNTVFGRLAGANIASGGINNTVFGSEAGNDISTGDKNTLIGYLAGGDGTEGLEFYSDDYTTDESKRPILYWEFNQNKYNKIQ